MSLINILLLVFATLSTFMDKEFLLSPKKHGIKNFILSLAKLLFIVTIFILTVYSCDVDPPFLHGDPPAKQAIIVRA